MENDTQITITLCTKDKKYAISDHPISVKSETSPSDLNTIVKSLLISDNVDINVDNVHFSFLIKDEFLVETIASHLSHIGLGAESVTIDYIVSQSAPYPEEEIVQDDFISCVKRCGKYILTGSYDETIQLWTVEGDEPIMSISTGEKVKCVEWIDIDTKAEVAHFLSGSFDQSVTLWRWNLESNVVDKVCTCRGHSEVVLSCAACPGLFASASWDATIKLWSSTPENNELSEETAGIPHTRTSLDRVPTRIPRLTLGGHREAVTRVVWMTSSEEVGSTSSRLASCSWDHSIRLWDTEEGREIRCIMAGHAFHDLDAKGSLLLAAASDNRVRVYDTRSQESLVKVGYRGHTGWLSAVAWSPEHAEHFVTGSIDCSVKLWDIRNTSACLYDLIGHKEMVTDVDWVSQEYLLSASADATVKIFRFRS